MAYHLRGKNINGIVNIANNYINVYIQ